MDGSDAPRKGEVDHPRELSWKGVLPGTHRLAGAPQGLLHQDPRGSPVLEDHPRQGMREAEGGEPLGVDHSYVTIHPHDEGRVVRAGGVQVGPTGVGARLPGGLVPALPQDPLPCRDSLSLRREAVPQALHRGGPLEVHPRQPTAFPQQVAVGVDESGNDGPSAQVEHAGLTPRHPAHVVERAHREDAVPCDGDGLRLRLGVLHGEDRAAEEHQAGFHGQVSLGKLDGVRAEGAELHLEGGVTVRAGDEAQAPGPPQGAPLGGDVRHGDGALAGGAGCLHRRVRLWRSHRRPPGARARSRCPACR